MDRPAAAVIGLVVVVVAVLIAGTDVWAVPYLQHRTRPPRHYPDDYLNAVACPSATQCWAVGQTAQRPGRQHAVTRPAVRC